MLTEKIQMIQKKQVLRLFKYLNQKRKLEKMLENILQIKNKNISIEEEKKNEDKKRSSITTEIISIVG